MKTCEEWALAFDQMYNNIASGKAPGLEPIEISRFLTDAQNAIVVALYKGGFGNAFESTEEVTHYLETLVKQAQCNNVAIPPYKLSDKSTVFATPSDLLFRTWEGCVITTANCGDVNAEVVPVTQDEYWRTVRNPFKKQNDRRVLRLSYAVNESADSMSYDKAGYTELVSDYPIKSYSVRYLAKPTPIILVDLSLVGLSIDGYTDAMPCKLPEALHQSILSEAVRMAKATWNA